jgi:phosphoglycerol transferase MdoB-like AlkP superfamily enzyme
MTSGCNWVRDYLNKVKDVTKAMKNNIGSLKSAFIGLAVWIGYGSINLLSEQGNTIYLVSALIKIGLVIAYLYAGLRLEKLLVKSSRILIAVVLMGMAFLVVVFLLCLPASLQLGEIIQLVGGLFLSLYLLINVRRLSLEERSKRGNNQ